MNNTALPRFGDAQTQDLINRLEIALNALEAHPLAGMVLIPVTFTAAFPAAVRVYHGMGHAAVGYFVVNTPNSFSWITEIPVPTEPDPRNYITLAYGGATPTVVAVF